MFTCWPPVNGGTFEKQKMDLATFLLHSFLKHKLFHLRKISTSTGLKANGHGFHDIPGPLSLPGIGTLYQYIPPFGKNYNR